MIAGMLAFVNPKIEIDSFQKSMKGSEIEKKMKLSF
jgi:hypothetical protein